ncbi:hypothetical protein X907_2353 [Glycocaulis alkaliphilus]|uniref:DUF6895 domain-containing protein n=1 Tax=Glycocaulis alkaliphilus TaxID=1434191 RepID=A0A3T0EC49_9PROT|nr:hypothetical protein [Glycocaulis alkaliphilus]AZU04868.1 hypothetical protein X907_2353 [Glycocaulis alkaliphilus]
MKILLSESCSCIIGNFDNISALSSNADSAESFLQVAVMDKHSPQYLDSCANNILMWFDEFFKTFAPLDPKSFRDKKISYEKVWAECSMLFLLLNYFSFGDRIALNISRRLVEPLKLPEFMHRVTRERARFGACIHNVALAQRLGVDVREEARYVRALIEEGGLWGHDIECWEKAETLFSKALLGGSVDFSDIEGVLKSSELFKERNICFLSVLDGYKITHAAFYHTGFRIHGLYDNSVAVAPAPRHLPEMLDALSAKFLLQGQLDLALEFVLVAILYKLPISNIHLQIISIALECVHAHGSVLAYIFDYKENNSRSHREEKERFSFGTCYHPTILFLLIIMYLDVDDLLPYVNSILYSAWNSPACGVMDILEGVRVRRLSEASPALAVGEMLAAAERYDLEKLASLLLASQPIGIIKPGGVVEHSLRQFLRLQARANGDFGYYDVEKALHGSVFGGVQQRVNQLVSEAIG